MENLKIHYKELIKLQSLYKYLLKETPLTYCHFPIIEHQKKLINHTILPVAKQQIPDLLILKKHYDHFQILHSFNKDFETSSIAIDDILHQLPKSIDGMKRLYLNSREDLEKVYFLSIHNRKIKYFFDGNANDYLFEFLPLEK